MKMGREPRNGKQKWKNKFESCSYVTAGFTGHEKMPVNQALPVFQPQFYQ